IRKTEYDPERKVLSVWFVASGKRYEFEGVPPETFAAFKAAFAKGRNLTTTFATISEPPGCERKRPGMTLPVGGEMALSTTSPWDLVQEIWTFARWQLAVGSELVHCVGEFS
ncbi:MAG: KTSC domain-containing protein, partial [Mesorhizobium sp.]